MKRSKKDWLEWFDNLNDESLSNILNNEKNEFVPSEKADIKIRNVIKEKKVTFIEEIKNWINEKISFKKILVISPLSLASLIFIVILFIFVFKMINNLNPKCIVTDINGISYYIDNKGIKSKLKINDKMKESYEILTTDNSGVNLKLNNKDEVLINNNTNIKLSKLYKDRDKEEIEFFLKSGEVRFIPKNLNNDSSFIVKTESVTLSVVGTDFTVMIDKDKISNVNVKEGRVACRINFDLQSINDIKKLNPGFSDKVKEILNEEKILIAGDTINISYSMLKNADNNIFKLLKITQNNILNDNFNKSDEKDTLNKLFRIRQYLLENKTFENLDDDLMNVSDEKKEFIIKKLPFNPNIKLSEKNTSVSTDGKNIIISSDSNKSIYSVNSSNGKLNWNIDKNSIDKITMPVSFYKNQIISGTPTKIIAIANNGKIYKKFDVNMGPILWSNSIQIGDNLFIPASQYVYKFNGIQIYKLNNFQESMGQLFISYSESNLYCAYSQEQKIKIYNLKKEKIIWSSEKLEDRIYMSPLITDKYFVIADIGNKIYRFNNNFESSSLKKIDINKGVISDLIYLKNNVYFVANNGYLYSLNLEKFESPIKITQVEKNTKIDKYLTKNLLLVDKYLLFASDYGKIFYYNIDEKKSVFINLNENTNPLIASPVKISNKIYFIDVKSNIYELEINK